MDGSLEATLRVDLSPHSGGIEDLLGRAREPALGVPVRFGMAVFIAPERERRTTTSVPYASRQIGISSLGSRGGA